MHNLCFFEVSLGFTLKKSIREGQQAGSGKDSLGVVPEDLDDTEVEVELANVVDSELGVDVVELKEIADLNQ